MSAVPFLLQIVVPPVPPLPPEAGQVAVYTGGPPEWVGLVAVSFFIMIAVIVVGFPLARAWARRMERGGTLPKQIPPDIGDRLDRIEQAVEAMSVEIERIGEGQRFLTQTMQGIRLPAAESPAQPLALGARVPAGEERR